MSKRISTVHPIVVRRKALSWSQDDLATHADIPRSSVSAIESRRLTPSVATALAVARALKCSVEELFDEGRIDANREHPQWAFTPPTEACRYWEAEIGGRRWLYPVESLAINAMAHDGLWQQGVARDSSSSSSAHNTLVMACCDPAAGLLATEYARASGYRLLILQRGSDSALAMLQQGLVHLAGVHRSTREAPERNGATVRSKLGDGYRLLRAADWQEVLALPAHNRMHSLTSIMRRCDRWAMREPGSAARECLDEMLGKREATGCIVSSHAAVATAVHDGWASAGICVQLSAEEVGLHFLPVRTESLDLCFAAAQAHDPRLQAFIRLIRSREHRRLLGELPGYDARHTGELVSV